MARRARQRRPSTGAASPCSGGGDKAEEVGPPGPAGVHPPSPLTAEDGAGDRNVSRIWRTGLRRLPGRLVVPVSVDATGEFPTPQGTGYQPGTRHREAARHDRGWTLPPGHGVQDTAGPSGGTLSRRTREGWGPEHRTGRRHGRLGQGDHRLPEPVLVCAWEQKPISFGQPDSRSSHRDQARARRRAAPLRCPKRTSLRGTWGRVPDGSATGPARPAVACAAWTP